jgi:hypothetical protein
MTAAEQWLKFVIDDLRSAEILLREGIFNKDIFDFVRQQIAAASPPPDASQQPTPVE